MIDRYCGVVRETKAKPAIKLKWNGPGFTPPPVQPVLDRTQGWNYILGRNNKYGTCAEAALGNLTESVHKTLGLPTAGVDDLWCLDLYLRSRPDGAAPFDINGPAGQPGDTGTIMSKMFEQARNHWGLTHVIAWAEIDVNDYSIAAAIEYFGGCIAVANLTQAQQSGLRFDYVNNSPLWGSHAYYYGGANLNTGEFKLISWQHQMTSTKAFRQNQQTNVYVVLLDEHFTSGRFAEAADLKDFSRQYTALTGVPFPYDMGPQPNINVNTVVYKPGGRIVEEMPVGWRVEQVKSGGKACIRPDLKVAYEPID